MTDSRDDLLKQWLQTEMTLHRFHDINFKLRGPKGVPHRGQGRILCIIKDNPGITQKELCNKINMRQQSVSELLKKLENNNYIYRIPSKNDKRTYLFHLTDEGKKLALPPKEIVDKMHLFFSCLSTKEQENMADYLRRVRLIVENTIEEELSSNNGNKME